MSSLKTYGAIVVMIGCFIIIYPRFMHPVILSIFGLREAPQKTDDIGGMYPPGHKGHPHGHAKPSADDMKRHMRHGHHPGMRAAADMQRQQSQQGSGRGMMGVVLPMYAVGICLYLGYTLYKVFNKSQSREKGTNRYNRYNRGRAGHDSERDRLGFPKDFDSNQDIRNFLNDEEHRHNLEELLTRVDDKNVSVEEMRVLQQRLEETEAQMTRILNAMQAVNANVDKLATEETKPGDNDDNEKGDQKEAESAEKTSPVENTEPEAPTATTDTTTTNTTKEAGVNQVEKDEKENKGENLNASAAGDGDDGLQEPVDQLIEGMKEESTLEAGESNVRQRNVKLNEQ